MGLASTCMMGWVNDSVYTYLRAKRCYCVQGAKSLKWRQKCFKRINPLECSAGGHENLNGIVMSSRAQPKLHRVKSRDLLIAGTHSNVQANRSVSFSRPLCTSRAQESIKQLNLTTSRVANQSAQSIPTVRHQSCFVDCSSYWIWIDVCK